MITCQLCGKELKTFAAISVHISKRHKNISHKEYYDSYLITNENEKFCSICGNPSKFKNTSIGYLKSCGNELCKHKLRANALKIKYGVENNFQRKCCKDKSRNTWLKNLGVDNPSKSSIIKQKKIDTNINNCGFDNWKKTKDGREITTTVFKNMTNDDKVRRYNKSRNTWLKNLGVDNPSKSSIIKQKKIDTCRKKYGCDYSSQNEEMFDKAQKALCNWKDYTLPSGKIIKLQGYEWIYLDEYFKQGNKEEDIIPHPKQNIIGKIWYYTEDGKKHRYFPDFYIPKDNLIVEVKCNYLYYRDLEKNILKHQSCINRGFCFMFIIYNDKKIKINIED